MTYPKAKKQLKIIADIRSIRYKIAEDDLPSAVSQIWSLNDVYANYKIQERLTSIDTDLNMMKKYWKEGVEDSQRPAMFRKIANDLDSLLCDMEMERMKCELAFYKDCRRRIATSGEDFTLTEVKAKLEAFVSDFAMTELMPQHTKDKKLKEIHAQHQKYLNMMFDYLLSIGDMTKHESEGWTDIFTTPTIDVADRKLLIAALLINMQNVPQATKTSCLVNTYLNADDENARQPALVGWALALNQGVQAIDNEIKEKLRNIFNDPKCVAELISLQLQIFMAMNAEKDSKTMSEEIDKVRLSNEYRKIADSLEGKDVDHSLDDVLNASENNAEVEEWMDTINKLSDMRKKGSDLFFNGFAQLKNAGFFTKASNWFVNFYIDHPDIASALEANKNMTTFIKMFTALPMLPTDKYSFVLLSARISRQLPPELLEKAFDKNTFPDDVKIPELEEEKRGLVIRDAFTKLLYRFYKLFGQREAFHNPMDRSEDSAMQYLFITNELCKDTLLTNNLLSLCKTMYKQGFHTEIYYVCDIWKGIQTRLLTADDEFDFLYFWGAYCHEMMSKDSHKTRRKEYCDRATKALELAHQKRPELTTVSKRLLDIYCNNKDYKAAIEIAKEMNIDEATDELILSEYAIALYCIGEMDEAEKALYKLVYLYPNTQAAIRLLPRLLMRAGKFEQTAKLLLGWTDRGVDTKAPEIYEYLAVCSYQKGDISTAVDGYAHYYMAGKEKAEAEGDQDMVTIYDSDDYIFKMVKLSITDSLGENTISPMDIALFVGCVSDRIEELTAAKNVEN